MNELLLVFAEKINFKILYSICYTYSVTCQCSVACSPFICSLGNTELLSKKIHGNREKRKNKNDAKILISGDTLIFNKIKKKHYVA